MLAIEPMVTVNQTAVDVLEDGWTAVSADGSLAAHVEHTVAVTDDGPWVLTAPRASRASERGTSTTNAAQWADGRADPAGR